MSSQTLVVQSNIIQNLISTHGTDLSLSAIKTSLGTAATNVSTLQTQITQVQADLQNVSEPIELWEAVTTLQGKVSTLETHATAVQTQMSSLEGEVTVLNQQAVTTETHLTGLQSQVDDLTSGQEQLLAQQNLIKTNDDEGFLGFDEESKNLLGQAAAITLKTSEGITVQVPDGVVASSVQLDVGGLQVMGLATDDIPSNENLAVPIDNSAISWLFLKQLIDIIVPVGSLHMTTATQPPNNFGGLIQWQVFDIEGEGMFPNGRYLKFTSSASLVGSAVQSKLMTHRHSVEPESVQLSTVDAHTHAIDDHEPHNHQQRIANPITRNWSQQVAGGQIVTDVSNVFSANVVNTKTETLSAHVVAESGAHTHTVTSTFETTDAGAGGTENDVSALQVLLYQRIA